MLDEGHRASYEERYKFPAKSRPPTANQSDVSENEIPKLRFEDDDSASFIEKEDTYYNEVMISGNPLHKVGDFANICAKISAAILLRKKYMHASEQHFNSLTDRYIQQAASHGKLAKRVATFDQLSIRRPSCFFLDNYEEPKNPFTAENLDNLPRDLDESKLSFQDGVFKYETPEKLDDVPSLEEYIEDLKILKRKAEKQRKNFEFDYFSVYNFLSVFSVTAL